MAIRPFSPNLTSPCVLGALSLMIILAAEALNQPPPRHCEPASPSVPAPFQLFRHVSTSYLALAWAGIRRKYQRILHGQLGLLDMVQLLALCSIVHGIRLWRKRSLTQEESPGISDTAHAERKTGGSTKSSSQTNFGTSRLGGFRRRMHWYSGECLHEVYSRAIRR